MIVVIVILENILECSVLFDLGCFENFFYFLVIKEIGSCKNCLIFVGVSDCNDYRVIEGIVRKLVF